MWSALGAAHRKPSRGRERCRFTDLIFTKYFHTPAKWPTSIELQVAHHRGLPILLNDARWWWAKRKNERQVCVWGGVKRWKSE